MNKLTSIILATVFLSFYSCGNTGKENTKSEKEISVEINACDEFLAQYEEWIDDYIEVINDYFNNPSDEINTSRYMELMQEGANWITKWEKLVECADDEKYKQRFEDISKEVENKLEELGL